MEKRHYNKGRKSLNDRIFWRIYTIERAFSEIMAYSIPTEGAIPVIFALFLSFNIFLASIPGITTATGSAIIARTQEDLGAVWPIVATKKTDASLVPQLTGNETLPFSPARESRFTRQVVVTFYSSTIDQTDSTPFITANGTYVRDGIVASNFLVFGTVVKFPELFGDKRFVVMDRMNPRYSNNHLNFLV